MLREKIKSTRKNESYCINDDTNKKLCILGDPNLCKYDFFSACLEANPEKARKKQEAPAPDTERNTYKSNHGKPFYDDEPTEPTTNPLQIPAPPPQPRAAGTAPPADPPPPAPPQPEADRPAVIFMPYDANDGIIEKNKSQNVSTIELATACLKNLIKYETQNSKSLAYALLQVKEKFFSEKGKKKGWKFYIEKEINFTYSQAQNLMKGYTNPIILEFWDDLGIGKISLLNRYKQPITSELINQIVPLSHREAKVFLFPSSTKSKPSTVDKLITDLKGLNPSELAPQTRTKLKKVLQETLKTLK
jgi:hypothetical protein